jgi:hypothetical protein
MSKVYANPANVCLQSRLRAAQKDVRLKERLYVIGILNISIDSLCDYETSRTSPPEDIIFKMAELYNDPGLILEALEQFHPLYGGFFREVLGISVSRSNLSAMALGYRNEYEDISELLRPLGAISMDEQIDDNEAKVAVRINEESKQFIGQAVNYILKTKTAVTAAAYR